MQRELAILVVEAAERAQRRQPEERLAESLHAPALVVDGHEQRRLANRVDLGDELLELLDALEVAGEEDDAADERRREPLALVGHERRASQIDHQRTERHACSNRPQAMSTTVPAGTRSNSSTTSRFAMRMQPIEPGTPSGSVSGAPWI